MPEDAARKSVKGTVWSLIERLSTMGIQLLCTLVIAQFLSPSEFGLVGMMTIFIAFSYILVDSGFGQAIIREKEVTQDDYSSIFYFNIALGFFAYAVMFVCAPFIAVFYEEPQLTDLLRVDFIAVICQAFCVVQMAQMYKSVDFASVSKVSFISVAISGLIGIAVAYIRHDVWGLIAQNVSFAIIRSALFWTIGSWRPSIAFHWGNIQKYLRFSMNLLGSRLIAALTDNAPNLFIGKSFTATDLGNYTVPNKLQTSIANTLSFSIHRVSYPIMATFQDDLSRLRTYSQKVVGMAFYVTAPIMMLLLIEAEDFFDIILSDEWGEAVIYFKYLCVIGAIFCFADINMDILLVRNRSDKVLWIEIVRKALFVAILFWGVMTDMTTLLQLLVAWNIFNALFVSYFAGREIGCSLLFQFRFISSTLLCLAIASATTWLIASLMTGACVYWRFLLSVLAGMILYVGCSYKGIYCQFIIHNIHHYIK